MTINLLTVSIKNFTLNEIITMFEPSSNYFSGVFRGFYALDSMEKSQWKKRFTFLLLVSHTQLSQVDTCTFLLQLAKSLFQCTVLDVLSISGQCRSSQRRCSSTFIWGTFGRPLLTPGLGTPLLQWLQNIWSIEISWKIYLK